jgi:hypothetical protein
VSVVRIEALRALAAVIEAAVPALAGKVKTAQQPPGVEQTYPTLTIVPGPLTYEPAQELVSATIGDPSLGNVIFNVGAHSGPIQLRLVASTIGERWTLEQAIANVFLGQELRPGVLVVPVTTNADLGDWIAAFEYTSDQWEDAAAFDRKLESLITVNGIIPALVARTPVYEIDTLVLGLTEDMTTTFTPTTMVPPSVEVVQINADGTIAPYP